MNNKEFKDLFKNNKEWVAGIITKHATYFEELAQGQSPKYLVIGCSDSRVPLSTMFNAAPGEFFIHRNIANQVAGNDINSLSVLEYAVDYLKVENIVVVGHYCCGGVEAAVDGIDHGIIENWVSPVKNLYLKYSDSLDFKNDKQASLDKLSTLNVVEQAKNIFKTPVLARAFKRGEYPQIHALIFNIYTGQIEEQKLPIKQWKKENVVAENYYEKE